MLKLCLSGGEPFLEWRNSLPGGICLLGLACSTQSHVQLLSRQGPKAHVPSSWLAPARHLVPQMLTVVFALKVSSICWVLRHQSQDSPLFLTNCDQAHGPKCSVNIRPSVAGPFKFIIYVPFPACSVQWQTFAAIQ